MDMTTPENGSPVLNVVSRISPTFTPSRLRGSKRRRRAPVGSSDGICEDCTTATGSLHTATADGGGSWIMILRLPGGPSVCTNKTIFDTDLYQAVIWQATATNTVVGG